MNATHWPTAHVLVTGAHGFLGRHVVDRLKAVGCTSFATPRSSDYDLREKAAVVALYEQVRPSIVIHLAAVVGGIGANQQRPAEFFYSNLMMGSQLLHEAWRAGVSKFVSIGTVCAYPKFTPTPFREEDLWQGYPEDTNAPYGMAKKMLLVQGDAYRRQYGFSSIFLLPANLYGPGDNFDPGTSHVIPALIRKCVDAVATGAESIEVWGDGSATRDFLYVTDAAEAVVAAAERYDQSDPVNIGSGREISIAELAGAIAEGVGFRGRIVWNGARPNGQPRRQLDCSRAESRFGFRARTEFGDGLLRTIAWYRTTLAARDAAPAIPLPTDVGLP
jgi:GDP-L-fucose synthase